MAPKRGRPKAPRMGRPPKPIEEVRRNRLVVMLTDSEIAALRAKADKQGVPFSVLARDVLARALRR